MDIFSSPWVIISLIMIVLIGNMVAFKYLTPKNLEDYQKKLKNKDKDIDRLIELDKKRRKESEEQKDKKDANS